MINRSVIESLCELEISVKENFSLKEIISLRIDCKAEIAVIPDTVDKFCSAMRLLLKANVKHVVIGNGTNVFFANEYFDGAVVLTKALKSITVDGTKIRALCGAPITALALVAEKEGLSGLEFAYGIPASVGGAVYMNAGAYGGAISDVLVESVCFDGNGKRELCANEHRFDYRKSSYMTSGFICLEATFCLVRAERSEISAKMRENMASRKEKQPLDVPNAGSYFKRPHGLFAAKLIDDCGLKGYSVGGAQVSQKHAGFIVNTGEATANDVLGLEEEIKRRVYEKFGVVLEREVRVID